MDCIENLEIHVFRNVLVVVKNDCLLVIWYLLGVIERHSTLEMVVVKHSGSICHLIVHLKMDKWSFLSCIFYQNNVKNNTSRII